MAIESDPDHPHLEEVEEGGPVKSFLEHLEDLRWMLIKSLVAVAVGTLLCLIAGNHLVEVLTWPLKRAEGLRVRTGQQVVHFLVGTNTVGSFKWQRADGVSSLWGSNDNVAVELVPTLSGTNLLLGLRSLDKLPESVVAGEKILLRNFSPIGGFWVAFQVAMYGGIVLAAPFVIYFFGGFVLPALKWKEKRHVLQGFGFGTLLFLTGVAFCYFVLVHLALRASVQYSEWLGFAADEWRAEEYISFVCKFMLGMGLGFEMPVVILTMVKIGILDYRKLAGFRRYMIVINLVLGGVLTTPEVLTQVMMFIPLQLLYELSIWVAWYWERRDRKRMAASEGV